MRVIAGEFRRRNLKTLHGLALRPTADRLREALFSVLAPRLGGVTFLDAYAGSGAVGIEALSRGAARAIFIEKHRPAVALIRENLASLGIEKRAQVACGKTVQLLRKLRADIVFLDPPYEMEQEYTLSLNLLGASPVQLVVAQHTSRLVLEERYGRLRRTRVLRHGDNAFSFFEPPGDQGD